MLKYFVFLQFILDLTYIEECKLVDTEFPPDSFPRVSYILGNIPAFYFSLILFNANLDRV